MHMAMGQAPIPPQRRYQEGFDSFIDFRERAPGASNKLASIPCGTNDRVVTFTDGSREGCLPPISAVDYRRYAAECVRLAQQVSAPDDKARLLDMAETYRELADRSETRSTGGPDD
jgi:hypothetical protein